MNILTLPSKLWTSARKNASTRTASPAPTSRPRSLTHQALTSFATHRRALAARDFADRCVAPSIRSIAATSPKSASANAFIVCPSGSSGFLTRRSTNLDAASFARAMNLRSATLAPRCFFGTSTPARLSACLAAISTNIRSSSASTYEVSAGRGYCRSSSAATSWILSRAASIARNNAGVHVVLFSIVTKCGFAGHHISSHRFTAWRNSS